MKLKIFIIVICLLIFGCKNKEEPIYITRIGQLTPGNGTPTLEVYDSVENKYTLYLLWFKSGTDTDTLPYFKNLKVIGTQWNYWFDLGNGNKRLEFNIWVYQYSVID